MTHTHSVLKETMRIYNPVPLVLREAHRDDKLLGYDIPKGTKVMVFLEVSKIKNKKKSCKAYTVLIE